MSEDRNPVEIIEDCMLAGYALRRMCRYMEVSSDDESVTVVMKFDSDKAIMVTASGVANGANKYLEDNGKSPDVWNGRKVK